MPHTPEEHFKMIVGLELANLAAQLATARAEIETLQEQLAKQTAWRQPKTARAVSRTAHAPHPS